MRRMTFLLAILPLLAAACASRPCAPVRHGREPLGAIWWMKAGDDSAWARPELDETDPDCGWRVVDVPGGLLDYLPREMEKEVVWLRVRFEIPGASPDRAYDLHLGRIDGDARIFLNGTPLEGVRVHASGERHLILGTRRQGRNPQNQKSRTTGLLEDENVLALRISGWQDEAGIVDGPIDLVPAGARMKAAAPQAPRVSQNPHAQAEYDPKRRRLTQFTTGNPPQPLLDDAHFILRTRKREYDLSRIPEAEIETLPGDRGVRTLHVLEEEGIRVETTYLLPDACEWPVLAVVGRATGGEDVDLDLVYHVAKDASVVGAGGLRLTKPEVGSQKSECGVAWGRIFVRAPEGVDAKLPESVRKYYTPEGALELMAGMAPRPDESGRVR